MKQPIILMTSNCYLPGYVAGGPIRSLSNMTERLGDEFRYKVLTTDRDLNDTEPYHDIKVDDWNRVGNASVFYMFAGRRSLKKVRTVLCETEYDILYLNSFFSPYFTIKPLLLKRLRLIPACALVVAPRGEFSEGALGLKSFKKKVFIAVAKAFGLYEGVVWQASSKYEEADIRCWFGTDAKVIIAPNLSPLVNVVDKPEVLRKKVVGHLKIIFLSRISRKKNLDGALSILNNLKGNIQFNIYGPLEDEDYWSECQKIVGTLPQNIEVRYCGSVKYDQVDAAMREHDLFFFPTLGENFGHVISEALCAGRPVLISDQTPWRDLDEKGVGWDLPLYRPEMFRNVLQMCVDMSNEEYVKWSERAFKYGFFVARDDGVVEQSRQLFYESLRVMNND